MDEQVSTLNHAEIWLSEIKMTNFVLELIEIDQNEMLWFFELEDAGKKSGGGVCV